jgi:hypothetical protein
MSSHASIAEQQAFSQNLFMSCQQRRQYYSALLRHRGERNEGNFLSAVTAGHSMINTSAEMDMRRKAEILQYTGASTQGGVQESRAQRFARVNRRGGSAAFRLDLSCNNVASIKYNRPTPTSSSGVPGPLQTLVYNPQVVLYNYVGMQQDMPQNVAQPLVYPQIDAITFADNSTTIEYDDFSYDMIDPSFIPVLSISKVTFFTLDSYQTLFCTATYNLYVNLTFTVVDDGLKVKQLKISNLGVQPTVYLMCEPQNFTFVLLTSAKTTFPDYSGPIPPTSGYYKTTDFAIGGTTTTTFPVTAPSQGVQAVQQQTDRLALRVFYKLIAFDENDDEINADAILNITDINVVFTLNILDVTYRS